MALGYCMLCKRLVPIHPVRSLLGPFPDWKPYSHDDQVPDGKPCDGDKKAIK